LQINRFLPKMLTNRQIAVTLTGRQDRSLAQHDPTHITIMAAPDTHSPPFNSAGPAPTTPIAFVQQDELARPERSDAAENRRRILKVAEHLFNERGVDAVNMQEIAKAAGVGQGTLYRRFANKGQLCLGMLDTQMVDFQNDVLAKLRAMTVAGDRRQAQIEWFLDALVHFNQRHAPLLCAALRDIANPFPGGMGPQSRSSPFAWIRMTVTGLLHSGVSTQEFAVDLDVPVIADALLGVLQPQVFNAMRADFSLERISAGLIRLLRGLLR
jgi:AcrR family transcriptional regulator